MYVDPSSESLRLAEAYRQKSDEELEDLAFDYPDLTGPAQQALRDAMRQRGMGDPAQPATPPRREAVASAEPGFAVDPFAPYNLSPENGMRAGMPPEKPAPEDGVAGDATAAPLEYSWKVPLCQCATPTQAWQLGAALKRAGLEVWISEQVLVQVAADQLDEARTVAERPIPQEIIDESQIVTPEFEVPVCPTCGAPDPLLADVEPENLWHCESCGREWTETR